LRPSNIDASAGAVEEVARIVAQVRARWPKTRIPLRADSGFAREALMAWCEQNRVDFVFGLAPNARLVKEIAVELLQAQAEAFATGKPGRRFKDFRYATLDSWSRRRRVIGKAEWTKGEANPRFIVTSLKLAETNGRALYEKVYCARGEMQNRIKECQGDLFADRASTAAMHVNPAQAVVRLLRLRPDLRGQTRRPRPHPVRRSDLRHDKAQAPQARRSCPRQRAARQISRSPRPRPTPTNGAWPPPASPEPPRRRQIAARNPRPTGDLEQPNRIRAPAQTIARARSTVKTRQSPPSTISSPL
jgi:ribosomal protein L29